MKVANAFGIAVPDLFKVDTAKRSSFVGLGGYFVPRTSARV